VMNPKRGTRSWAERTSIRSYTSLTKRRAPKREHDDVADDEDLHCTHSCTNFSNITTDGSIAQQIQTPHSPAVDPVHWAQPDVPNHPLGHAEPATPLEAIYLKYVQKVSDLKNIQRSRSASGSDDRSASRAPDVWEVLSSSSPPTNHA
jgi:hypothetical protein